MPIFKWDKVIQKLKQKSHGKTWLKFHLIQIKLSAESCSDSYCISWPGFPTGDRKLLFIEFVNALLSKYAAESRTCERVHPAIDLNSHFLCTRTKLFLLKLVQPPTSYLVSSATLHLSLTSVLVSRGEFVPSYRPRTRINVFCPFCILPGKNHLVSRLAVMSLCEQL